MTFNIWVGGEQAGPTRESSRDQTLAVMRAADADVICVQEQGGNAERYAAGLGYRVLVQDRSTAILARHEIVEASPGTWGAKVRLRSGRQVWVFNVHFPAAPYQPYQLAGIEYHGGRLISTEADAITEARLARGENALRCLRDMQPALRSALPVFLCGDFNEPSCLDWTEAVVAAGVAVASGEPAGARGEVGKAGAPAAGGGGRDAGIKPAFAFEIRPLAVDWPTTRLFHDAGFRDSFRDAHPDPVAVPGYTWTPRPSEQDVLDRIDLVLYLPGAGAAPAEDSGSIRTRSGLAGSATGADEKDIAAHATPWTVRVVSSRVVGEGAPPADVVVTPYPSDHRAVVTAFEIGRGDR